MSEHAEEWEPNDFIVSEEMGDVDTEGGVTEEILEIVEKRNYIATQPVLCARQMQWENISDDKEEMVQRIFLKRT